METGLEDYRGRFAAVQTGFGKTIDQGSRLIEVRQQRVGKLLEHSTDKIWLQELLNKLDCSETELRQTKLDLDNERSARRRLQQDALNDKEQKERQGRRPFVVALIDADADGYVVRTMPYNLKFLDLQLPTRLRIDEVP